MTYIFSKLILILLVIRIKHIYLLSNIKFIFLNTSLHVILLHLKIRVFNISLIYFLLILQIDN